jgi:hypothetical protein
MAPTQFNHPDALEILATNPRATDRDVVAVCPDCNWTYFLRHFHLNSNGFPFRCLQCGGGAVEDILPCCLGTTHVYRPFQVPWTDFTPTLSQELCNQCRGVPPIVIPPNAGAPIADVLGFDDPDARSRAAQERERRRSRHVGQAHLPFPRRQTNRFFVGNR